MQYEYYGFELKLYTVLSNDTNEIKKTMRERVDWSFCKKHF